MTSILLHEYVEQVEKLIDANRLVEAIEHCRHILHHYPRHIDTYRVMGKALLEKREYDAATDLFLRILGADPNDFISHVGLSIIYKEESQYDQALWHLERAYEIQPYNVAIQGELRKLYAVETETRPGIIPLTRGALARLYMQGELYQQAITELRRILAEEPERMDLQVLLAEALWRDNHRIDAEEACLSVLEELPNCIVLNAILAEIWLQTGRIPEAQKYLHRLHALTWQTQKSLDKETIAGSAFAAEGAFSLPDEAPLDFLQTGMIVPDQPATPTDDWVNEVDFDDTAESEDSMDQVVMEPESGMHSYDWLADIGSESSETAESKKASETDWFSQESAKDALDLATSELNADWLAGLRGDESDEEESGFQPLDLGTQSDAELNSADENDWFSDGDELPDDLFAELDDQPSGSPAEDTAVDTDSDWLNDLAEAEGEDKRAIQIDATNLIDDKLMDWADGVNDSHVVEEPKTPFWLSKMADEEMDAVQLNPEDALDWLTDEPDELEAPETAAKQEPVQLEAEDPLDWLNEVPGEPINGDELLDEDLLADLEDEAEVSFETTAALDPEDQVEAPETLILTDTSDLGEADDWLAALTEGGIEEEIAWDDTETSEKAADDIYIETSTDELAALSDADDWLESAAADLDAILDASDSEPEDEFPNLKLPDMEGAEITDIPNWLQTNTLDPSEEAETAMSENDPQEKPQSEEPQLDPAETADEEAESSDLDWLNDLTSDDDDAASDAPSEPPIETEGMPSWLVAANLEADVEVVDEWDSESAEIPDWLQEPMELSDLDDDALLNANDEPEAMGLTGLLSEMDVTDEPLPLDEMDSLMSDWVDEDADGSLTELLGEFDTVDSGAEMRLDGLDFEDETVEDETAVPTPSPKPAEEPEETGLTGLLSSLSIEDDLPEDDASDDDDFLSELLTDANDDDLSGFLWDDEPEAGTDGDDALDLDELDLENVSLTAMLSDTNVEDEEPELASATGSVDEDDWLSGLSDIADEDALTLTDETEEEEPELGLTGMLAKLWLDDEPGSGEDAFEETAVDDLALDETSGDGLGLTELLSGIDYAEDVIDSRPELPVLDEPVEPSLTEILSGMEVEEDDKLDEYLEPISAEDTTWLTQLEADTDSLREQPDDFDMAEETGLDWLTMPDEPEAVEAEEATPEPTAADDDDHVVTELDSTPEDWDDAMSWLEELAAQQDDPVKELPSVAENMLDEELDTSEALKTTTPVDTGNMDWLDDLTGKAEDVADEAIEPELVDEQLVPDTPVLAESLSETEAEEPAAMLDDFGDDDEISWLDELATDRLDDTAVDETEMIPEPIELEAEALENEDEDVAWLDAFSTDEESLPTDADLFGLDLDELEALDELETAVEDADLGWLDSVIDEVDGEEFETVDAESPELEAVEMLEDADSPDELYRVTGVTDALKQDDGLEEAEADLEEALAWLDELDEEPEAETLDEAPPTIVTPAEPHDLREEYDDDEEPETVVLPSEPDELTLALDRLEQQVKDEGIDVPDTAVFPISLSDEELNAALDWIEESETETETEEVAEELETAVVSQPEDAIDDLTLVDSSDMDDLSQMADDPEAWLEQLLSGDGDLDIDMEPPPIKPSEDAAFVTEDAPEGEPEETALPELAVEADAEPEGAESETADSLLDDVEFDGIPDDPDAAIAWLDQLVSGDDALDIDMEPPPIKPSEDAVYVTEDMSVKDDVADETLDEVADETIDLVENDLFNMEDDPEAWLAQMLSSDGDLDIDMEPPPIKASEDAVFVTDDAPQVAEEPEAEPDLIEAEAEETVEERAAELSATDEETSEDDGGLDFENLLGEGDDPEAWLEQLLSGDADLDIDMAPPPIKASEDAVYVTDDGRSASIEAEIEAEIEPEVQAEETDDPDDIIAEVPDDPDEAMAWLEQLAARQGADLAELPSVTEATAEPEMANDLEELTVESDIELAEAEVEIAEETVDSTESLPETGSLVDDDVDSELPDWLGRDDHHPVAGETDWLQSLPEVDMDSWLSAEEEATTIAPAEEVELPDTGPLRSLPTIESEPVLEDELFEPVIEPSSGAYSVDEAKLSVAQEALADGRINEAITQFKDLVASGSGMMAIIAELEQAADAHPQTPTLFQVLGDAYMRNGQLQKALSSYRSALDQM